ncbi:MAG: outer membrane murein-binding lipoprotein Lpp, partial [Halopseudomonas sp.]
MKKMMIAAAFLSAFALTGCVTTSDQPQ